MTLGHNIKYYSQITYRNDNGSQVSVDVTQLDCYVWGVLGVLEYIFCGIDLLFGVAGWHLVKIFNTDLEWPTYSPESKNGSQVSLEVTQLRRLHAKRVRCSWARFVVTGWDLVTIFDTDLDWTTYSPESNNWSQVSLVMTQLRLLYVKRVMCYWAHVLWSLDETWSQYLKLTLNDFHHAL